MQFGDHSWISGLSSRPELNGKHVVLREWQQEAQRWRCEPIGWSFEKEMVSLRPKNLSNEPPPAPPPKTTSASPDSAFKLMALVEREGQLRLCAHLSPEARLRHLLCQRDLFKVQADILSHRDDKSLSKQACEKLDAHEKDLAPVLHRWQAAGGSPVDVWEDDE